VTPAHSAVVLLCGPRAGGNSDTAGLAFADGLARAGVEARVIRLREQAITPCRGCGSCAKTPQHRCPLSDGDDVEALFSAIMHARILAFASPVYFYHVPALFKALIDRAQRHYEVRMAAEPSHPASPPRSAQVLLVAGRKTGERLFEGTLLTLKYFLWPFYFRPAEPCLLRGLDAPGDLAADAATLARVSAYGEAAASEA
jgi:putative NADPH-quinone reductase